MPTRFKVLVVDDSPTQQLQIQLVLEGDGYDVLLAGNGLEALGVISDQAPDIVVTDLQMPEMNGLELVSEIKARYPSLPVILTTAVGSESIAAQALHLGATSYVPKRDLNEILSSTVRQVLDVIRAASDAQEVAANIVRSELHFEIGNSESLVPSIIARMEKLLAELSFCDEMEWMQIAMALDEAIVNAIFHGNLEVASELRQVDDGNAFLELVARRKTQTPYRSRTVKISLQATPAEATFVIRDSGTGFDSSNLPDPTDPANLERAGGRGLLLIHSFMDDVRHNDIGNEITMIKRKPDPAARCFDADDDDIDEDD
jgi:CheY-like chemotaxis protein/anti-sigma regulatory factor (Ser/Thr protein kinase)